MTHYITVSFIVSPVMSHDSRQRRVAKPAMERPQRDVDAPSRDDMPRWRAEARAKCRNAFPGLVDHAVTALLDVHASLDYVIPLHSRHRARARSTPLEPGSRDSEWCDFAKFSTIDVLPNVVE